MNQIHPTAIIEDGAEIGQGVVIEPYAIVKKNVKVGDQCVIKSHVYLDGHTTIGEKTTIWPSASIGTQTQDKKFAGETTYVKIGSNCQIREFVTINSSCEEGSIVEVGNDCLIMAYCHVAHNCKVGNGVIMANGAMLAGHVEVENYVTIGGMTPVHQKVRIGESSMVGGFSRITHDIPPYTIGAGYIYKLGGLNIVGLKRKGFSFEVRQELAKAYRMTYKMKLPLSEALIRIEKELTGYPEILHWVEFCKQSTRGLSGSDSADAVELLEKLGDQTKFAPSS